MAGGTSMTRLSHLQLEHVCCCVPAMACLSALRTDYSDTLSFSLTGLFINRCGNPWGISSSVRLPLIQAWHRVVTNGMSCASVRYLTRKCACLHFKHADIGFYLSIQFLSILRSIYQTFISLLALTLLTLIRKELFHGSN